MDFVSNHGMENFLKSLIFLSQRSRKRGKGPKCPGIEVSKEYSEMWVSGHSAALGGKEWGGNDAYIRI